MQFIIFLGLFAFAAAQGGTDGNPIYDLIKREVESLMGNNANLTVNLCTGQCDQKFDLGGANDERWTDTMCRRACTEYSRQHMRPDHNIDNLLDNIIHAEVEEILKRNTGISVEHCATKCDALFDLELAHDEEITDRLCRAECDNQINQH